MGVYEIVSGVEGGLLTGLGRTPNMITNTNIFSIIHAYLLVVFIALYCKAKSCCV